MRIVFVSHSSAMAGGEKMMINLVMALGQHGDAECLILTTGDGPMLSVTLPSGCRFHRIQSHLPWYLSAGSSGPSRLTHLDTAVVAAREIASIVRDWGADLLVVNTLTNLPGLFAAAQLNLPTLAWVHGIIDTYLLRSQASLFKNSCDELILRCAARLVCPSQWTADYFARHYEVPLIVIPNATYVPETLQPAATGVPTFCCLNSWEPHKGLYTLIDAALILQLHGYDFRVHLYGSGPLGSELQQRIRRYGLQGVVKLCRRTGDIEAIYQEAHALVSPSEVESFGMTLIEAMSYARPVIVSDTCGHREIVDGPFGWRCPLDSPAAFAACMARVITHPNECRRMGEIGWKVAHERYTYSTLRHHFVQTLTAVIAEETKKSPHQVAHRYALCRPLLSLVA